MEMNVIKLNLSRTAYNRFAGLYKVLSDFSYNENVETTEQLSIITKASKSGMPLPSGRWGECTCSSTRNAILSRGIIYD